MVAISQHYQLSRRAMLHGLAASCLPAFMRPAHGAESSKDNFVSYRMRSGYSVKGLMAPRPLTAQSARNELAKHYFFRENQVEIPEIKRNFGKVVRFATGGSRIVVSDKGHILTNSHVVDYKSNALKKGLLDKERIIVKTTKGTKKIPIKRENILYAAEYPKPDLALLHVPEIRGMEPVTFEETLPKKGETVFAIGNPVHSYGHFLYPADGNVDNLLDWDADAVCSVGNVLGFDKKLGIEADTEIKGGNSGGLLVNSKGNVVGIVYNGGVLSWTFKGWSVQTSDAINILKQFKVPYKTNRN